MQHKRATSLIISGTNSAQAARFSFSFRFGFDYELGSGTGRMPLWKVVN